MLFLFQISLFALVALSLALVVFVPVTFASANGLESSNSRKFVFSGASLWLFLVFLVGILNSFVV